MATAIAKTKTRPFGLLDFAIAAAVGGIGYLGAKLLKLDGPDVQDGEFPRGGLVEGEAPGPRQRTEEEIAAEAREITRTSPGAGQGDIKRAAKSTARSMALTNPVTTAAMLAYDTLNRPKTPPPARFPLVQGMQGPLVAQMQIYLNKMGANLKPDGIWGPATTAALNRFYPGLKSVNQGQHLNMKQRASPNPKLQLIGESKENWLKRNGWTDAQIAEAKRLVTSVANARTTSLKEAAIISAMRGKTSNQRKNLLIAYRRLHPKYSVASPFLTNLTAQKENWTPGSKLLVELRPLDK